MAMPRLHLFMWVVVCGSNLMLAKPTNIHNEIYNPSETKVALYLFGDSLLDFGNNNYLKNSAYCNLYPYGETFFNYPSGRCTNGRNIADFIAAYLKLPLIPPYLLSGYQHFLDGATFASASAGALNETNQGLVQVLYLRKQLDLFKEVEAKLIQTMGKQETKSFFGQALFFFGIGANDYVAALTTNSTMLQNFTNEEYADMVIGNITTVVKEIYKIGGRRFGFLNVPPLGCTPMLKASFNKTGGECVEEVNELVKLHNKKLPEALQKLHIELEDFGYSIFNFYTTLGDRMQNPSKYGFKYGQDLACCGSGSYRGIQNCGVKTQSYELCKDPKNYVHFDSIHPTDGVNIQLSELVWNGGPDVSSPQNIRTLLGLQESPEVI